MKRLSVCFDGVAIAAFEDIKQATGITVIADILRQALTVFMALLAAERRGCQIIMKSPNGQQFRYSLSRPAEMIEIKGGPEILPNPIALTPTAGAPNNKKTNMEPGKDRKGKAVTFAKKRAVKAVTKAKAAASKTPHKRSGKTKAYA